VTLKLLKKNLNELPMWLGVAALYGYQAKKYKYRLPV